MIGNQARPNLIVEAILSRRSVREGYTRDPVPPEVLEEILRCGLAAPSSKNARPWCFHVVTDSELLDELATEIATSEDIDTYVPFDPLTGKPRTEWSSTVTESAAVLREVPSAIFIENTGVFSRGRQTLVQATPEAMAASMTGYMLEVAGVGAAIQNMWIAAIAHGLACVFMGDVLVAEPAIKKRLSIECDLVGVLALGYADSPTARSDRGRPNLDAENVRWRQP